jgi:heme-degrading monooxygenase HmoA
MPIPASGSARLNEATRQCPVIQASTALEHQGKPMKKYVLIIHEVESYPAWKTVFEQAAGIRKQAGEISYQLFRYDTDANQIIHLSIWDSLDNARSFFESDELIEIRKAAGVRSPSFIYLEEIETKFYK